MAEPSAGMFGLRPLPRHLDAALRDSAHERLEVRLSALRDLARLAEGPVRPRAVAALSRALLSDSNALARSEAAVLLADVKASEARAELLAALEDAHGRVRQMAVLALGEIGEPGDSEIVAALGGLLASDEAALRFQALIGFERLAGALADDALVRASRDVDDEVRGMAFRLAERRLEQAEPPAALVEAARRAVAGAASVASTTAALFLAARGDRTGAGVLVGVLDGRVPAANLADVQTAMETVADLGLAEARAPLARRAFGLFGLRADPIAWQACIALARLGDARAQRTILRGLDAWTRDARTLAVFAAGRAGLAGARERLLGFRHDASRADPEVVEEALSRLERVG